MYNLEFELNKKDFIALGRDLLCVARVRNKYLLSFTLYLLILGIILFILFKNFQSLLVSFVIFSLLYYYFIFYQCGNSMYKIAKETSLYRKFEFGEEGFVVNSEGCISNYRYDAIKELYNAQNSVIIFLNKQLVLFIPKRIIQNVKIYDFLKQRTGL